MIRKTISIFFVGLLLVSGVFPLSAQDASFDSQGALCVNVSYEYLQQREDNQPDPDAGNATNVTVPVEAQIVEPEAVLFIFDGSESMNEIVRGGTEPRIDVAKRVFANYVSTFNPDDQVGLRLLNGQCETRLLTPISALGDPTGMINEINSIVPTGKTPLAAAIQAAANDISHVNGIREVVIVSDGEETCGGDPVAAAAALARSDPNLTLSVSVVGFNILNDVPAQDNLRLIPEAGGGVFVTADNAEELAQALSLTDRVPFFVTDSGSRPVDDGLANRSTMPLEPANYQVSIPALSVENLLVTVNQGRGTSVNVGEDGAVSVNPNDSTCIAEFCPKVPLPRLHIGDRARVAAQDPRPLNVRDNPGTSANQVLQIPVGTEFEVIDGPICRDGYLWWHIQGSNFDGWAAEGVPGNYFVESIGS